MYSLTSSRERNKITKLFLYIYKKKSCNKIWKVHKRTKTITLKLKICDSLKNLKI